MASISLKYKSKQGNLTAPGDVDPGAMIPIATVTVGSGGATNVEFTSIPTTGYSHLQIRGIVRLSSSSTNRYLYMRMGNNSFDTGTNYNFHTLQGDGASVTIPEVGTSASSIAVGRAPTANQTASVFGTFVIDILDYADTNKNKTIRTLIGFDNNGSGAINFNSGAWRSTSAVNQIRLFGSGEDCVQNSHFALYGIKGA